MTQKEIIEILNSLEKAAERRLVYATDTYGTADYETQRIDERLHFIKCLKQAIENNDRSALDIYKHETDEDNANNQMGIK